MREISFLSKPEHADMYPPVPAKGEMPPWIKQLPQRADPKTPFHFPANACNPFVDGLTAGYMVRLPAALYVRKQGDRLDFHWPVEGFGGVHVHPNSQVAGSGWENRIFQMPTPWMVKTPPGYSVLVGPPHSRTNLPFRTLHGVIDADTVPVFLVMTVVWDTDQDETYIDAGTPIGQIVPFKRESWDHRLGEISTVQETKFVLPFKAKLGGYRRLAWKKKTYS